MDKYQKMFVEAYFNPETRDRLLPLIQRNALQDQRTGGAGMNRSSSRLEERIEPFLLKDTFFQKLQRKFSHVAWKLILSPSGNYVEVDAKGKIFRGELVPGRPPSFNWNPSRVARVE